LERVYVNGQSTTPTRDQGLVALQIEPTQAGDQQGTVELFYSDRIDSYHLTGDMTLILPITSWPIQQLYLTAHLPGVFNYQMGYR